MNAGIHSVGWRADIPPPGGWPGVGSRPRDSKWSLLVVSAFQAEAFTHSSKDGRLLCEKISQEEVRGALSL